MPVTWADVVKSVGQRLWTINEAWALIQSSSTVSSGSHPEVHVLFPEKQAEWDKHFITQKGFKGKEYRDRERHSAFRNAWEAAGAVCAGFNSEAGERALTLLPQGDVILRSRSALIGSPQQFERLQLEYQGQTTGVSYFESRSDFVFIYIVFLKGYLALKTVYPATGGPKSPPAGKDAVEQGGSLYLFSARS